MAAKRVVLAYSGGLDTSVAVRWMREEWGAEVIACAVDVGQLGAGDADMIRERSRSESLIRRVTERSIETPFGPFRLVAYLEKLSSEAHLALAGKPLHAHG